MAATLYYVHDPMCSWCWAFRPTLGVLLQRLPAEVAVVKLLGGLAPDSDTPMAEAMRQTLQQTWRRIQQEVPGTRFNFDFWHNCQPRRSTWPACRAVLAAREQGADEAMLGAIQHAYYLQARNPSDKTTLRQLAMEIGIDDGAFAEALESPRIARQLEAEMDRAAVLGVDSYPSLVLQLDDHFRPLTVDYRDANNMLANIEWMLEEG